MSKLSNKKIEDIAVHAVDVAFDIVPTARPRLNTNDKELVIDGYIEVFDEGIECKSDLLGKIPVQVKGTTSKPNHSDRPTKMVNVEDIRILKSVFFGALYFVVYMSKDGAAKQIYYKQYLPYDIEVSLRRVKGASQKTLKETFSPLPEGVDALDRLCKEFLDDWDKQRSGSVLIFDNDEEATRFVQGAEELILSKRISNPDELTSLDIWQNGGYWYSKTPEGLYQAIRRIDNIGAVSVTRGATVASGDYSAQVGIEIGESDEGNFIRFGGFSMHFGTDSKITYHPQGNAQEALRDSLLTKAIVETGALNIDGISINSIEPLNLNMSNLKLKIANLKRLCDLIDFLKIKKPIYPYELCEEDAWRIDRLISAFLEGNHVPVLISNEKSPINLNVDLSIGRIKVFAIRKDDALYEFINPFGAETVCKIGFKGASEEDLASPLPAFFMLSEEDLEKAANLDATQLEASLSSVPVNDGNADIVNAKLLDMIYAYDQGAVCSDELLGCCLVVADALVDLEPQNQIYLINRAQVLIRGEGLDDQDKAELREIVMEPAGGHERAGAYIVLGDAEMSRHCLDKMANKEREDFLSYPIGKFAKELLG